MCVAHVRLSDCMHSYMSKENYISDKRDLHICYYAVVVVAHIILHTNAWEICAHTQRVVNGGHLVPSGVSIHACMCAYAHACMFVGEHSHAHLSRANTEKTCGWRCVRRLLSSRKYLVCVCMFMCVCVCVYACKG